MAVSIVDDTTFKAEVLDSKMPVLLDFYAEWCGPCKMLGPVIEVIASKFDGKVKFVKLNTDNSPVTAQTYEVKGIPTLLFFQDGHPVDRRVGYVDEHELEKFIRKHVEA